MRTSTTKLWLAGTLVLLTGVGCTPMDDALAAIFGRSMRVQPNFNPYEDPQGIPEGSVSFASGNFPVASGVVNLGQAEGTPIPPPVTPFQLVQALADPAGFPDITGLENPVPASQSSLARGEEVYDRACMPCHGQAGDGGGTIAAAAPVMGYSLLQEQSLGVSDGYIYSIIRVGRGAMPAYGHQITHYDRWHVVNYLRQLQGQLPAQTQPESETEPGTPEN
jgi:mono/diheme cytochrome c family protein